MQWIQARIPANESKAIESNSKAMNKIEPSMKKLNENSMEN